MQKLSISQKALEHIYTKSFPEKVKHLHQTLRKLEKEWNPQILLGLVNQVTKIMILAETLHLVQIQNHCKNLLNFLIQLQQGKKDPHEEILTLLQGQVEALSHSTEFSKMPLHFSKEMLHQLHYHSRILCAAKNEGANDIAEQFSYFGYQTQIVHNFEALYEIIEAEEHLLVFAAIIIDTSFCENATLDAFEKMPKNLPLIFISDKDSIEMRLFAVRAGGKAFLSKPLEFINILEKVDDLIVPVGESTPYRILMIEDSKTQASIIQQTLIHAGMIVDLVLDPFQVNERLSNFQPELILMDIYMPACNGIELAAVIRQQENYVGIPIVFLSSESDLTKQMDAMRLGGDDFLTKPIREEHLIAAVSTRIERSRALRATMIQDGLTGLLNHTRVLEQLENEIARAHREQTELSFVMFDIDNFKKINDQYGHPIGDRVLKSLSRLFKQRFRKSDSVGRYGGEEFAAILPRSSAPDMKPLLESIRTAFSQIVFQTDSGEEFSVTISGGVAHLSDTVTTLDRLIQAADKALYQAKNLGKNQIVVFSE